MDELQTTMLRESMLQKTPYWGCQAGFVLNGSDCIPEASNITIIINGTIGSELLLLRNVRLLEQEILEKVASVMETFSVSHRNLRVFSHLELEKLQFVALNHNRCNCDYSAIKFATNISTTSDRFQTEILSQVRMEIILYLEERNIHLESVESEIHAELNDITYLQYETSNCICFGL